MKKSKLLALLQEYHPKLVQYGVKSIAVFGSVARDEATPTSDIDLLVEFDGVVTFDRYMDLKFYLEDNLGQPIDLVMKNMLKPQIQETVLREAVYVS
ncbi:MAG: nucleotidyltransferase family protein [Okeania sp. SIO3I5]|uniref:nucleotidyltransferase family protein n=1 Tax=Okeania sp. SIO3I5 TaxID=2607805 RepID=UPI0013B66EA2|nr:nucleotidyltransferase family protein [Okeania sp. SIO3I5]NEQ35302.1 nucleotidyltransferase family protein [Okeania sp. SIO3I5]